MSGSSLRIVVPALLVIVGSVPANLPPAHAADGTIVVQRQVQPRVAYRPSMVPDPHPTVVDTNVSAEVNALANGAASGNTVSRELGDADFAIVTSGSGIRSMILTGSALPGFASQPANPATVQAVGNLGTSRPGAVRPGPVDRHTAAVPLPIAPRCPARSADQYQASKRPGGLA